MNALEVRESLLRSDSEARERSQREFDRPMVVEAGAGTGKTTVLVARIAAWCLGPGWQRADRRATESNEGAELHDIARRVLSGVVAITFTEAAAAEMESRTTSAFREIADGKFPIGVLEAALPDADVRMARAAALAEAVAHLGICTIHAFCRRILAAHPLEAGLHPAFQVDADSRAQQEAVREAIEQAVRSGYQDPGDPDLLALAIDGYGPAVLEEALLELVAQGVSADDLDRDPFSTEAVTRFFDALQRGVEAFDAAGVQHVRAAKKARKPLEILDAIDRTRQRLAGKRVEGAADLASWLADLEECWAGVRDHLKKKWAADAFGIGEREALGEHCEALSAAAHRWLLLLDHCVRIDPERLESARHVLKPLVAGVHEELRRRGYCSYARLLSEARSLLKGDPEIRSLVQSSIDQLLVDEFQDTDPDQCEIVAMLALEGPEEQRPGLFLVGDPKQSIYGFRRADLRAYQGFIDRAVPDVERRGRLSKNFRSLPPILDEVERLVGPVMCETPGVQPAFERLVPSEERCDAAPPAERGVVEHWISWDRDVIEGTSKKTLNYRAAELEAAALARDLADLGRRDDFEWRDAAVLFRTSGDMEIYLSALREAGIPYLVERERTFYRRREILDAAAYVRCVLDRDDHLALLATLRSSAVGVPDAALLPLWSGGLPNRLGEVGGAIPADFSDIDACIDAAREAMADNVPGIDRVKGWDAGLRYFARALTALRHSFDTEPVDVFVERLRTLSLLEVTEASRFLGDFRVANLDRFFREVRDELDAAASDVQGLLRRLRLGALEDTDADGARPSDAVDDAVRVMTIHKAKGLDFKHTYVVQLHKMAGGRANRTNRVAEAERVGDADGAFEYALLGARTPGFHAVVEHRAEREAAERVRTLYVALTRAKDRLVLLGAWDRAPFEDESRRKPRERAESFSQLAAWRDGLPPLCDRAAELASGEKTWFEDEAGVRWCFPSLEASAPPDQSVPDAKPPESLPRDPAGAVIRLRELRAEAAVRMSIPTSRTASNDATHSDREEQAERRRVSSPTIGVDRDARRIAGTAVHRMLEDLDLNIAPMDSLKAGRARLPEIVAALTDEPKRDAALTHAREVIDRLEGSKGAVLDRLSGLGDRWIARELPVLLPPAEGEVPDAVGFVVGTLDLVYRDPETERLIVVDFKTDEVNDPRDLDEKKQRYASQGAVYQRALREALALDYTPRFELWMLWSGDVIAVA